MPWYWWVASVISYFLVGLFIAWVHVKLESRDPDYRLSQSIAAWVFWPPYLLLCIAILLYTSYQSA